MGVPNIECWLVSFAIFQGIWTSIGIEPYSFVIFQGMGVSCPPTLDLGIVVYLRDRANSTNC